MGGAYRAKSDGEPEGQLIPAQEVPSGNKSVSSTLTEISSSDRRRVEERSRRVRKTTIEVLIKEPERW